MEEKDLVLSKIEFLKSSDLLNVLNGAYLANRFFDKSTSWFSQKLNNHINNGESTGFTEEEMKILRSALVTLSIELQDLADELQ